MAVPFGRGLFIVTMNPRRHGRRGNAINIW
jgi:hypothetical protein